MININGGDNNISDDVIAHHNMDIVQDIVVLSYLYNVINVMSSVVARC